MITSIPTYPLFEKTTLDNGVRVISETIPSVRSISVGVWIFTGSRDEEADESGIRLQDSSMTLGTESGISLEGPTDSGISLDADFDEGITLAEDDDSGISIGDAGDSGIALASDSGVASDDEVAETQFEIPPLGATRANSRLPERRTETRASSIWTTTTMNGLPCST